MTITTQYFGDLSQVDAELVTIDNASVVTILREVEQDLAFYNDLNNRFFAPLTELVTTPQKVVRYYDGEALESLSEGGRPLNRLTNYDYNQEIPFQEFTTSIGLSKRAVQMMTADELAGFVQAKLAAFQKAKFSAFRTTIFTNTNRTIIDSINKYQTVSVPFWNSDSETQAAPVPGYSFAAGDLQNYTAVASAGNPTLAEVRSKLIDKVRRHGFKQLEIWVSDFDYALEALAGFVPAENQIGRNLEILTQGASNERQRQLSSFEGLVGFISNVPIVKTPIVPAGYAVCVGVDGMANKTPFLQRVHPVETIRGLQVDVKGGFPLEQTVMSDGWGFSANHRGAVAVLQTSATSYSIPANL
jgi:hypothetical protein